MDKFLILKVVYQCPKCGKVYNESGIDAQAAIRDISYIKCPCGFLGELGV